MSHETIIDSDPYVGRWHGLVSTTNWEKGRIILEWRQSLVEDGAPSADYSDETWSQMVGAVTAQHVGRLRRVYERFSDQYQSYQGLYWSHFHAALDWEDAEMWLEGAVQNGWSVSQTRRQRWETLGGIPEQEPLEDQVVTNEIDEDVLVETSVAGSTGQVGSSLETVENLDRRTDNADSADFRPFTEGQPEKTSVMDPEDEGEESTVSRPPVRPFADLPELPEDISAAFEAYKLAIIRHRLAGWQDISQNDLVTSLESLKQLALAPAD